MAPSRDDVTKNHKEYDKKLAAEKYSFCARCGKKLLEYEKSHYFFVHAVDCLPYESD